MYKWEDTKYRKKIIEGLYKLPTLPVLKELKLGAMDLHTRNSIDVEKIPSFKDAWSTFPVSNHIFLDYGWEVQINTQKDIANREPVDDSTKIMLYREDVCPYGFEWDCSLCFVYSFLKEKKGTRSLFCTGIRFDQVTGFCKNFTHFDNEYVITLNDQPIEEKKFANLHEMQAYSFQSFSLLAFSLTEKRQ